MTIGQVTENMPALNCSHMTGEKRLLQTLLDQIFVRKYNISMFLILILSALHKH